MRTRGQLHWVTLGFFVCMLGARATHAATDVPLPQQGSYSAALFYNLANSYAREGKPGLAVLNYERARLLAPEDPDVRANLRDVRSTSGLPLNPASRFERIAGLASTNTFFWLGCAGLCITGASVLARRWYPRYRHVLWLATGIGLASVMVTLCDAIALWPTMSEAVVMTPGAAAHIAPASMADPVKTLSEGEVVSIVAERADFALVRTQSDATGWVARADLARVVPQPG